LQVVAEGVEDGHAFTYLGHQGCDLIQGYHVSKPVPPAEFTDWLRTSAPVQADGDNVLHVPFGA
jgi:EAL domain-containing protein (putative c-di-GMP-specific phosphodiesterase class I)